MITALMVYWVIAGLVLFFCPPRKHSLWSLAKCLVVGGIVLPLSLILSVLE